MRLATGSAVLVIPLLSLLFFRTAPPLSPLPPSSFHKVPPQQVPFPVMQVDENEIWKGSVTFHELAAASFDRDNSNGASIDHEVLNHNIDATVVIHACGPIKELHASSVQTSRSDVETYHKNEKEPVRRCPDEDPETNIPGRFDSYLQTRNLTGRFYDSLSAEHKEKFGSAPPASIHFALIPPNRYHFVVDAAIYTVLEGSSSHSKTLVCSGVSERYTRVVRVAHFGKDPQPTVTETAQGTVETVYSPPHPYAPVFGFIGIGEFTPKGIGGQTLLVNKKAERPGDMARTIQVSWEFEPKGDACTDAYDLLYQDLAWAEAYANADLADRAGNLEDLKKLVGQEAYENYGSWLPPDMMGASVAMSVDPETCGLHGFEDAEVRVERQCLPKVIYEAVLTHELEHVRQCQSDQEAFGDLSDFRAFARYEVKAHLKGINYLKDYVENHCEESGNLYNISDVNARIARLEAWLGH